MSLPIQYHISPNTGRPNLCKALNHCPFGGEHFDTKEEAYKAIEEAYSNPYKTLSKNDFVNNSGKSYENYTVSRLKENFGHRSGVKKFSEPDGLAQLNPTWSNYPNEEQFDEEDQQHMILFGYSAKGSL